MNGNETKMKGKENKINRKWNGKERKEKIKGKGREGNKTKRKWKGKERGKGTQKRKWDEGDRGTRKTRMCWWVCLQTGLKDGFFLRRWNFSPRHCWQQTDESQRQLCRENSRRSESQQQHQQETPKVNSSVLAFLQPNNIRILVQTVTAKELRTVL